MTLVMTSAQVVKTSVNCHQQQSFSGLLSPGGLNRTNGILYCKNSFIFSRVVDSNSVYIWKCFEEKTNLIDIILRATGSDEDEDSENEASLMKELKDLYDKQHLTSESTASRQRQTPKKMAKNKFQTATRSSPRLRYMSVD